MSHTPRRASCFLPSSSKEPLQKRRPSSPTSIPQLSIADRFMSTSFDSPSRKLSSFSNPDIHAHPSEKDPERLVIASTFMKSSDESHPLENGPIHPLDTIPEPPPSNDYELDLDLPPTFPRPFGSQDTLVNQPIVKDDEEKKYDKVSLAPPSFLPPQHDEEQQPIKARPDNKKRGRQCSRRWRVFTLFISTLCVILVSGLLWPRTPLIRLEGASLVSPVKITETNAGVYGNVQFETEWRVNYTVDNRQNWLPTRLVQVHILVKVTGNVIGKGGNNDPIVLDPGVISTLTLPVALDYQARQGSDTTFSILKNACLYRDTHESLSLSFWMTLHIWGLDFFGYRPTVIVAPATGGFVCPLS